MWAYEHIESTDTGKRRPYLTWADNVTLRNDRYLHLPVKLAQIGK